jgi:DNA-binding phage protein
MSAIVAFRKNEKNAEIIEVDEATFKTLIIQELVRKHRTGVRMYQIAKKTGLSMTTISKICCGETSSPHLRTIMKLAKFLKIKIFVQV